MMDIWRDLSKFSFYSLINCIEERSIVFDMIPRVKPKV